jgi:hypothetical protein
MVEGAGEMARQVRASALLVFAAAGAVPAIVGAGEGAPESVSVERGEWPAWAESRDADAVARDDDAAHRGEAMRHGGAQHALLDTSVRVEESGETRAVWRDVIEIGSESGLARAGELTIAHVPGLERVVLLRLRRRKAPGAAWEELTFRTALESAGKVDGMFVDERTVAIIPEGLGVGDTIDFAYMIVGESPLDDFEWEETDDVDTRVASRRVVIELPRSARPTVAAGGFATPSVREIGARLRVEWEARDVAPAAAESWLPTGFDRQRRMLVSTARSFSQLGASYRRDLERLSGDARASALARQLVVAGEDPLAALSTWVQEHIRYVGLELAAHRTLPAAPDATLARGYGDCKDMSALLCAMLRSAGVEAWPAFARTADRGPVDPRVPMLSAFNHEIVAARRSGAWVFVDPTLQEAVPPWSGAVRAGERLLVADGKTGLVEAGPQPDSLDDVASRVALWRIACADGSGGCAALEAETRYAGPALADMRALLQDGKSDEIERDAADYYRRAIAGRALLGMRRDYSAVGRRASPLVIRERFDLGPKSAADACFLRYTPPEIAGWLDLPPVSGRASPLGLGHPRRVRVELEIRAVPVSMELPAPWEYRDRYVRMERRAVRGADGTVRGSWLAQTLADEVPLAEVTGFATRLGHAVDSVELALCPGAPPRAPATTAAPRADVSPWLVLAVGLAALVAGAILGAFLTRKRRD